MNEIAHIYHLRCVTLAQTLVPRNLTNLEWYMTSSSYVQKYRDKKIHEEEAMNEEQNKKFHIELASDLEQLRLKADKSVIDLLEHIYKQHPPRKEDAKMGSLGADDLTKTVKKAILHYHPDSQTSFNDEKWTFLCSEITKLLNMKYTLLN